ncbi:hypothetical protein EHQ53_16295 [Leptospira langatensis]|uniref:Phosphotyrosine protein phosphatase I domain-containing protein n=1 Tax=Leptospira langatensis TaxID=2484983 RepID=A0A5F1ZND2_9LEPT|nr:hypothetical protein [Leptospira langatensis]TGK05204.1 hypothetical protein EHO57_00540 [Leptospira langatensis]TGL38339.1 hypothetical protein EHQ53_16295 [Leptospira langatensis]
MSNLFEPLKRFLQEREAEYSLIDQDRKRILLQFSESMKSSLAMNNLSEMVFVCTHNSRRSQIAQLLMLASAEYLGVSGIGAYSGGTEVTALHHNSAIALEQIGFKVDVEGTKEPNPKYWISYKSKMIPVTAYSKLYSGAVTSKRKFIAVMVCSSADEACPFVPGAFARISLPYSDPKEFDSSADPIQEYIRTCEEIGREMLFALSNVKQV